MLQRDFYRQFPDENSCKLHFKQIRDRDGVICKKCGGTHHYWLCSKWQYQCKDCGFRTTLRSGTLMESSKLPFKIWYEAIFLISNTAKSISARQLQRQLGYSRYEPIWYMLHKIRSAMGKELNQIELQGHVELDDSFFPVKKPKVEGQELFRTGRGSEKKQGVLVYAESELVPDEKQKKNKPTRRCKRFRMVMVDSFKQEIVQWHTLKHASEATVWTDGYWSFRNLKEVTRQHVRQIVPSDDAHVMLPWVHIAIGNAKRLINGVFHHVNKEYLQNYLDEFCYKLNHRYSKSLFTRLIHLGATDVWYANG